MTVDITTPIALAMRYLDQDPVGWKVLMSSVTQQDIGNLLQESLMWNARFLQKAGMDSGKEPQEIGQEIIYTNMRMREIDDD